MQNILSAAGILIYVLLVFIAGIAAVILYKMWTNQIDLKGLVSEKGSGKASLSRFQFLLFTFIIGGGYLTLVFKIVLTCDPALAIVGESVANACRLPGLDQNVLVLLGISGAGYLTSKGIQTSQDNAANVNQSSQDKPAGWQEGA